MPRGIKVALPVARQITRSQGSIRLLNRKALMKKPLLIDCFRENLKRRRAKEANAAHVADDAWQLSQQWNLSFEAIESLLMIDERTAFKARLAAREARHAAQREHHRQQTDLHRRERQQVAGELLRARQQGDLLRWLSRQGQSQPDLKARFDGQISKAEWESFALYQRRLRVDGLRRATVQEALGCTTIEMERWIKDGRLIPDGQCFSPYPWAVWRPVWLPETVAVACEQRDQWRLIDANAQHPRQPQITRQHPMHGRVTALLNRIYRLPGAKILTLATGDEVQVFDVAESGEIGDAPEHKKQLRQALARAMADGGGLIVRRFLTLTAIMNTPHGAGWYPVKELSGVALGNADWRALTKSEVRSYVLPGEANVVFADFPT